MRILVIIVSYNFERWMSRCLGSLRQSDLRPDVVVVDNASTDRTVELIERDYPEVRLIKSNINLGFGKANNIGLKMACEEGYDAAYLLNQDAWIRHDTLEILVRSSDMHKEYGVLSPVHLDGTEEKLDNGFADYSKQSSVADIRTLAKDKVDVVRLPFVNAAHWFIPIKALKRVGGFSPLFFMYGEDVDWINRLKHSGYAVGYCPAALAVHDRAGVKKTKEVVKRANYVFLLSEYSNVNRSLLSAFAYSVLASLKSAALGLSKGRWDEVSMYMDIFVKLVGQTLRVVKVRRTVESDTTPFLGL